MGLGGVALRTVATTLYALEFCCTIIILGIYGYFLAMLGKDDKYIGPWVRAVEGIAGVTALYLLFAVLLTCFLGARSGFAYIAMFLNLIFFGAFVAIAVLTRRGASSCTGWVKTPLGDNWDNIEAPGLSDFGYACTLNKVVFAVSIIGAGLILISIFVQFMLRKHREHEKREQAAAAAAAAAAAPPPEEKAGWWPRKSKKAPTDPEAAETGIVAPAPTADPTGQSQKQ